MKKQFFYFLVLMMVAAACNDVPEPGPLDVSQINFEKSKYVLIKEDLVVKVISQQEFSSRTEIPFTFKSDAEEGVDYEFDKKSFVFEAGTKEAEIKITRKTESEEKKLITITLNEAPEGFELGLLAFTTVELASSKSVIYSFEKRNDVLSIETEYVLALKNFDGTKYKAADALSLFVEINPEKSTAVEGVHFEFDGAKEILIKKNGDSGSFKLKHKKTEEGKDLIVVRLSPTDGFIEGNNPELNITVKGAADLSGKWEFKAFTNKDWFASSWNADVTGFPTGTAADLIKFESDGENWTVVPEFTGSLANYFTKSAKAVFKKEREEVLQEESGLKPVKVRISVLEVEDINVNFSATNKDIRKALVGFRTFQNAESQEILEMTIFDYEPTDFFVEFFAMIKDGGDTPFMLLAPIRVHFVRK